MFCFCNVANCAIRYFQKPRGTSTSYEKTTDVPFPAITVCGSNFYNEDGLKKCGVQVINSYLSSINYVTLLCDF